MSLQEVLEEVAQVAEEARAYAYQYVSMAEVIHEARDRGVRDPEQADLLEVRVEADGSYTFTACDKAGRRLGSPVAPNDGEPFVSGMGVSTPRRTVRDEIREEERRALEGMRESLERERRRLEVEQAITIEEPDEIIGEPHPSEPIEDEAEPEPDERGAFRRFFGI